MVAVAAERVKLPDSCKSNCRATYLSAKFLYELIYFVKKPQNDSVRSAISKTFGLRNFAGTRKS